MAINRILVVGSGNIARRHLGILADLLPRAELAVYSRSGLSIGDPEQNIRHMTDFDEALAFAPQIAVIANPTALHLETAIPLARNGANLFIEKPLAMTTGKTDDLIAAIQAGGVKCTVGYNLRHLASFRKLAELLVEKAVGEIYSVRCEVGQWLPSWRPGRDYRTTISAQKTLGGGVLLELSHEIDYLLTLFGPAAWINASLFNLSDMEIDVEDTAVMTIGFKTPSRMKEIVATLQMDFIRQDSTRSLTVIGSSGSLKWNLLEGTIELFRMLESGWQCLYSDTGTMAESYISEWKEFLSAIDQDSDVGITLDDGIAVLKFIETARQSAVQGRRVIL